MIYNINIQVKILFINYNSNLYYFDKEQLLNQPSNYSIVCILIQEFYHKFS